MNRQNPTKQHLSRTANTDGVSSRAKQSPATLGRHIRRRISPSRRKLVVDDGRGAGPMSRANYAIEYFLAMSPSERRVRLRNWAVKPNLTGRVRDFLFPSRAQSRSKQASAGRGSKIGGTRVATWLNRTPELSVGEVHSWTEARDTNFAVATRILDAVHIQYVEIDDVEPTRRQIAVASVDRPAVVDAFERFSAPGESMISATFGDTVGLQSAKATSKQSRLAQRRLLLSPAFIIGRPTSIGTGGRSFGLDYGTVVSFWERSVLNGQSLVVSDAPNRWGTQLPEPDTNRPVLDVVKAHLTSRTHIDNVSFPIDLVCLWVDGDDEAWLERRRQRMVELGLVDDADEQPAALSNGDGVERSVSSEATKSRLYRSRDELRFAIRSAQMYAPFINHVYLVTDGQRPDWLADDVEGITVVDHKEIFPPGSPPVFNSSALDTRLHHIPGLSEHFLVSNDDIFFINPTFPVDFFTASGAMRLFLSKARIPIGDELPGEPAVDSAIRNTRRLIEREHGVTITQKFKHIPIPQRISVRRVVAERYSDAVEQTTESSFRSTTDISFSHLTLYESLLTGEGVVGTLPYDYVGLDSPRLDRRLELLREDPGQLKVVCLNDAEVSVPVNRKGEPLMTAGEAEEHRDGVVRSFLNKSFPFASRFERHDTTPAEHG